MLAKADSKRRERRPKGGKGGTDAAVSDRKASPISTSTTLSDRMHFCTVPCQLGFFVLEINRKAHGWRVSNMQNCVAILQS